MIKFSNKTIITILFIVFTSNDAYSQLSKDSTKFVSQKNWKTIERKDGFEVLKFNDSLFHTKQRISIILVDTTEYSIALEHFKKRTTISAAAQKSKLKPIAAINGGFYDTKTKIATHIDYLAVNNEVKQSTTGAIGSFVGFNRNSPTLVVDSWNSNLDRKWSDIMTARPICIKDGKTIIQWQDQTLISQYSKEQIRQIFAPRTVIGQNANGQIVLIVIDGRQKGAWGMSFEQVAKIGEWLKLVNMICLDGGGSSTMWTRKKEVVNTPSDGYWFIRKERPVANAVMVFKK